AVVPVRAAGAALAAGLVPQRDLGRPAVVVRGGRDEPVGGAWWPDRSDRAGPRGRRRHGGARPGRRRRDPAPPERLGRRMSVVEPPPRRRRGRPVGGGDRAALILDAARREFAAQGYDAVSLRGIARAAGVDPALVHHYFDGKEALFVAAMQ